MCWRKWLAHLMDYVFIFFELSEGRYGVCFGFGGKGVLRLVVGLLFGGRAGFFPLL